MKEDAAGGHNLQARALARAAQLRPPGLTEAECLVYDRIAPPLCHPTKDRLTDANILMFLMLVRSIVRYEGYCVLLADLGETYESVGRAGRQLKSRPEVAQLNETWRQVRALASDFGMTPAAERALGAAGQLGFDFDDDGFS